MKVSKYTHNKLNDSKATFTELDVAYDLAREAAIEQGYDPDTHVVVASLAKRANALRPVHEAEERRVTAEHNADTVKRLDVTEQDTRTYKIPVSMGHIARVGNSMRSVGKEVVVDTKTNLVLTTADQHDNSI